MVGSEKDVVGTFDVFRTAKLRMEEPEGTCSCGLTQPETLLRGTGLRDVGLSCQIGSRVTDKIQRPENGSSRSGETSQLDGGQGGGDRREDPLVHSLQKDERSGGQLSASCDRFLLLHI